MKNLLTLFLTAFTALSFAQNTVSIHQPKQFKMLPNSAKPAFVHRSGASNERSFDSCNVQDILDYSTYNELLANQLQVSYKGSWNSSSPQPYANEIRSSFIDVNSASNLMYSYATTAFDTLAFANFANTTTYSKQLRASTITLDTLGMFVGVSADDTTNTGGLVGDSLILKIYAIVNGVVANGAVPVQTQVYSGYTGLQQFLVGTTPGYLKYAQVPVNYTFGAGQGFAVRLEFHSGDTSSHCFFAYSYADSCGTVVYQGNTYASPAVPSTFDKTAKIYSASAGGNLTGNTYYGEIDSVSPTSAKVTDVSNGSYFINIPGIPTSCQGLYVENWEFIALVSVQSALSLSIIDSNYTIPCTGSGPYTLHTSKSGDFANATYQWSSNVYGSQTTANTTIFNPGTYAVTATNSQGCSVSAVAMATSAAGNQTPSFSFPAEICANQPATFTNTSSDVTGYSPIWYFVQGPDSVSHNASPSHTFTTVGNYNVGLVIDSAGCEFGTTQSVSVLDCTGFPNISGFEHNVSIIPNPSNGNVNIAISDADKNVTITVYNILGETVRAYATTESSSVFNKNIDLTNLANGSYLVKIQSGSKMATKKLVIAK